MIRKIKKAIKNPKLAFKYVNSTLFELFLFDLLYKSRNEYIMKHKDIQTKYLTTDNHSKHWFFPRYDKGRIHEPIITKMIISTLNSNDVFVDVGAHLGYFTCIAGKICTNGKVYGFEVDKLAFDILERNIVYNGLSNVEVFNYGVTDNNGYVKIPKKTSPNPGLSIINDADTNHISVKAVSLDNFFRAKKYQPTTIKIDVEGAELLVLKGMKNLLETQDLTLFLELHGNNLNKFNTNSQEIISFLEKRGYVVYEILNHRSNNINEKRRLKKLNSDTSIKYNTMCFINKKIKGSELL